MFSPCYFSNIGDSGSHSLSGVRLDGVQEAAVLPLGADETDAVEGGVVQTPLVGLHLQRQEVVPRDCCLAGSHGGSEDEDLHDLHL